MSKVDAGRHKKCEVCSYAVRAEICVHISRRNVSAHLAHVVRNLELSSEASELKSEASELSSEARAVAVFVFQAKNLVES